MCVCCHPRFYNADANYFQKYVCWTCRLVNGPYKDQPDQRVCSRCNKLMYNAGMKFKPPKKKDIKRWNMLKSTWVNHDA